MSGELKDSDRMEQIMQPFRVYDTEVLKSMYFRVYANVPEKREAIYIILTTERYLLLHDGKFLTLDEYDNLSFE